MGTNTEDGLGFGNVDYRSLHQYDVYILDKAQVCEDSNFKFNIKQIRCLLLGQVWFFFRL